MPLPWRLREDVGSALHALRSPAAFALSVLAAIALSGGIALPVLSLRHRHAGPGWSTGPGDLRLLLDGSWPAGWGTTVETNAQHAGVLAARDLMFCFAALAVGMACASIAALVLARAAGSRQQVAIRAALGASPGRVLRDTALEALLLGGAALIILLAVASAASAGLRLLAPDLIKHWLLLRPGASAVLVGLAAPSLALLLFAPLAALPAASWRLAPVLGSARTTSLPGEGSLRGALAIAQLTAALSLLVAAGLLLSDWQAQGARARAAGTLDGPLAAGIAVWSASAPPAVLASSRGVDAWRSALRQRLDRVPGVRAGSASPGAWIGSGPEAAAMFTCPRCRIGTFGTPVALARLSYYLVDAGFFATLGVPVRGRELPASPAGDTAHVAVINRSFEALFQGTTDPIGQHVRLGETGEWYRIIGVVPDLAAAGVGSGLGTKAAVYLPLSRFPSRAVEVFVRAPAAADGAVRQALAAGGGSMQRSGSLHLLLERLRRPVQWLGDVCAALAALVLLLAVHGVVVVAGDDVRRRRRELAVRSALGATPLALVAVVLRRTLLRLLIAAGCATEGLGLVIWLLGRMAPTTPAWNAPVYLASLTTVALAALLASARAMHAASRSEPREALAEQG